MTEDQFKLQEVNIFIFFFNQNKVTIDMVSISRQCTAHKTMWSTATISKSRPNMIQISILIVHYNFDILNKIYSDTLQDNRNKEINT